MLKIARVLFVFVLAIASVAIYFGFSRGVETSVTSLVGGNNFLAKLSEKTSKTFRVYCEDKSRVKACRDIYEFDNAIDPEKFLATLREKRKGLLTSSHREELKSGKLDKIRRRAKRRDYMGVSLFTKEEDPFYFLSDFIAALKALQPKELANGGEILTGSFRDSRDEVAIRELLALAKNDEGVFLSGAPFHTLLATEKTKREINILGVLSFAIAGLCGFLLFRSPRFLLPTFFAIASGFLIATAVVFVAFSRPHAMTFLFGTTLIGLGVDYCYHALATTRDKKFLLKLSQAFATTSLAFSPLLFSGARVLREMAVFTIVGLFAIYLFAILFLRTIANRESRQFSSSRKRLARLRLAIIPVLAILAIFAWRNGFIISSDPSLFHAPESVMARGEAKLFELTEEATSSLVLVPLKSWQEENAALKEKLAVATGEFLTARDLPSWMTLAIDSRDYVILPKSIAGDGYEALNPKLALANLFSRLSRETINLLAISFVIFLLATIIVFRKKFFFYVFPIASAVVATTIVIASANMPFTFFSALCFFVLVGLGIDYTIFHREAENENEESSRVVFFSFLTSFASFALLAMTSFPVTRTMGFTLAIGLFFAYLFSIPKNRDIANREKYTSHWAKQKEQSAGKIRILILFWLYRFLGKNVAKILFFPAFLVIYPFCRVARDALAQYYEILGVKARYFRHLLSFAWSMFDKTDACSLCKNPPKIKLSGDLTWMNGGVFLLATHVGCIEVLPALRAQMKDVATPKVHAFQQMGHNAIFTKIFSRNAKEEQLILHAVEDIGVETAVEMQDALSRGELVLMAGDRVSAGSQKTLKAKFLGRDCVWPKGVFRFARAMEKPVFAIVCVNVGWNKYEVIAKELSRENLLEDYVKFLEAAVQLHPYQWYQFYRFF